MFKFRDVRSIYEMVRRAHGVVGTEGIEALDQAVTAGRGGVFLHLTDDQYAAVTATSKEWVHR